MVNLAKDDLKSLTEIVLEALQPLMESADTLMEGVRTSFFST